MPDPPPSPHPLSYAPSPERPSRAGIISFTCGLLAILSVCFSLVAVKGSSGSREITRLIAILIFVAFLGIVVLGLVTGILGVLPPRRNRGLAMAGLILNSFISFFILLLVLAAVFGHI